MDDTFRDSNNTAPMGASEVALGEGQKLHKNNDFHYLQKSVTTSEWSSRGMVSAFHEERELMNCFLLYLKDYSRRG
jgi:hypothetical protein